MPFNRLFEYVLACFLLLAAVSCREGETGNVGKALVIIGDTCLYDTEVALAYATRSQDQDSITFVKDYAERWAMEMLFYGKALQNVPEDSEIERMVAIYRKNLIIINAICSKCFYISQNTIQGCSLVAFYIRVNLF